jgi:hypothetical protein
MTFSGALLKNKKRHSSFERATHFLESFFFLCVYYFIPSFHSFLHVAVVIDRFHLSIYTTKILFYKYIFSDF